MLDQTIRDGLLKGRRQAVDDAIGEAFAVAGPEDLSLLIQAYRRQRRKRDWLLRSELLDLIFAAAGGDACAFLLRVARSREHWFIRRYAMINLIDLGGEGWRPASKRRRASDFYAPLMLFADYVEGRIGLDEVRAIGRDRMRCPGDSWEWLTHLERGEGGLSSAHSAAVNPDA